MKAFGNILFTSLCVCFIFYCSILIFYNNKKREEPYVKTETIYKEILPQKSSLININTATYEELTSLQGIGGSYAERIINYRLETGGFSRIDEIMEIKGIGEKVFESIKDYITV